MAQTYGLVNLVSSFGFSHSWRKSCIAALAPRPEHRCADLMSGMCESSILLARHGVAAIEAVDFCPAMVQRADAEIKRRQLAHVRTTVQDVFSIAGEERFDRVTVSFGLKTLDNESAQRFAGLLHRLLKPGGRAALVEIAVPDSRLLRWPYLFYLRYIIPLIGRLFLGNPDCYRSLAIYTESFSGRERFTEALREAGFGHVMVEPLFLGCARLYVANKSE